jgi:methionine aminotransferase
MACAAHHLHRDVEARGRLRRDQPVAGLSRFSGRAGAVRRHLRGDARRRNQYPPMAGVPAARGDRRQGRRCTACATTPSSEITVTAGATQAIFTAIAAFVRPGDEVIVFRAGLRQLRAGDRDGRRQGGLRALRFPTTGRTGTQVRSLITPRTRMIIINSPHNPTGSLLDADDLDALAELTRDTDIVVLADEVYEHIVFDGATHARASPLIPNWRRAASSCRRSARPTTSPAGRSATCWRLRPDGRVPQGASVQRVYGQYAVPARHRRVHARRLAPPRLAAFYQAKRDSSASTRGSRFELLPAAAPTSSSPATARSPICLTASLPTG